MKQITHFEDINGIVHPSRQQALTADLVQRGQALMSTVSNAEASELAIAKLLSDAGLRSSLTKALLRFDREIGHAKVLDHSENVQRGFA